MAINVKAFLAYTLLELSEKKSLEKITASQLITQTGISRRTFYSHFQDKSDLICYVYKTKILDVCEMQCTERPLMAESLYFETLLQYKSFMVKACKLEGQNCLTEYMHTQCKEQLKNFVEKTNSYKSLTAQGQFAVEYHSWAMTRKTIDWILAGMKTPPDTMSRFMYEAFNFFSELLFFERMKQIG